MSERKGGSPVGRRRTITAPEPSAHLADRGHAAAVHQALLVWLGAGIVENLDLEQLADSPDAPVAEEFGNEVGDGDSEALAF